MEINIFPVITLNNNVSCSNRCKDNLSSPPNRNHITHHYDNARTGWNPFETTLTVDNVKSPNFRKLFEHAVDGDVYAQPLYVQNLNIPQKGQHNVVFVATESNWVYAFDADSNSGSNASFLWSKNLCLAGEVPVDNLDIPISLPFVFCTDINPHIGITSTPVVDPSNNTLYVVAKSKNPHTRTFFQRIHAVDIASGIDKHVSPVEIHGNDQGITFDPLMQFNRAGLLLNNGVLYIAFACHCDVKPYYGWIIAYDVSHPDSETFLNQIAIKNLNPTRQSKDEGGGIWMAGYGVSCDSEDNIYFTTGNGLFNADTAGGSSYGDSVIKMQLDKSNRRLNVVDYFTPSNQEILKNIDLDLGSGGVLVIPDQGNRKLITCGGKDHVVFVINRTSMGKYAGIHHKSTLSETAIGSPALAAIDNSSLIIVWTGRDLEHHVNVATSDNGSSLTSKVTMNETSIDGPNLAFGNGIVLVSWTGSDRDHHLNVVSANDNNNNDIIQSLNTSPNQRTLSETSNYGPALAFGNGLFFMAWTGADSEHSINIISSNNGTDFPAQSKLTLNESTSESPALSFVDGKLYLLWRGNDGNQSLNILESTDAGRSFTNKQTLQDSSNFPPGLALDEDLLYLVWTGRDERINSDSSENDNSTVGFGRGNKMTFPNTSIAAPSLSIFNKNLYIIWTGTDILHSVNIATLEADRLVQRLPGIVGTSTPAVFGGPAYYRGKDRQGLINEYVYYCGKDDHIKSFTLSDDSRLSLSSQSKEIFLGSGGTTPCVSSNLDIPNSAIVWATTRGPGKVYLRAYNAENLSADRLGQWEAGKWNKRVNLKLRGNLYNSPTIANGKVYVASQSLLTVFGL